MAEVETKRNSACDECRTRKLKCSGDLPTCTRCATENIACVYSPRKQMGRPRKRRRDESAGDVEAEVLVQPPSAPALGTPLPDTLCAVEWDGMGQLDPALQQTDMIGSFAAPAGLNMVSDGSDSGHAVSPWTDNSNSGSRHTPSTDAIAFGQPSLSASPIPGLPAFSLNPNSCTCLANMYLTTSRLQAMETFRFPFAMQPLRACIRTLAEMTSCRDCGPRNLFLVASVLQALIERFQRLLNAIDEEADQLEASGETKLFRMGDLSSQAAHYHGTDPDCPAGFEIRMNGQEWRSMAKKVIRELVLGSGGNDAQSTQSVTSLLNTLEQRQKHHHQNPEQIREAAEKAGFRKRALDAIQHVNDTSGERHFCLRVVDNLRFFVDMMDWDEPEKRTDDR